MQEDFDVAVSDLSSFFEGEHGGNHIIARGSIGRWDGVRHGMTPYDDLKAALDTSPSHSNTGNVFADCEIDKIWDENGRLFVTGAHHDGRVTVELRQLTDAGEEALKAIEDVWANGEFIVAGKIYDGSPQSVCEAMNDLWSNPGLAPLPRYMEQAFGCPAEEYEEPEEAREQESGYSLGSEQRDAAAAKDALGGTDMQRSLQHTR